jgi:hypothetical protein
MEDDHGLFENAGLPNNNFVAGNTGRETLLGCFVMIFGGGTCSRGKESTFKFGCYKATSAHLVVSEPDWLTIERGTTKPKRIAANTLHLVV